MFICFKKKKLDFAQKKKLDKFYILFLVTKAKEQGNNREKK